MFVNSDYMMKFEFSRKLSSLPELRNYYSGLRRNSNLQIPDNILMFSSGAVNVENPIAHHRFLLVMNLKNPINLIIDSRRFTLGENKAMLVLPHQYHLFVYENYDVERLLITFEGCDMAEMQKFRERVFTLNDMFFRTLSMILDEYLGQLDSNNASGGERCALLLSLLLMDLEKCSRRYGTRSPDGNNKTQDVIDKINRYVQSNLQTPLDIKQIAEVFKYSGSHLRLIYRKAMGISIGRYIRETKIHKACGYLGDSRTNISGVAEQCGYSSIYAFSHAFKNETGVYPGEYRKKTLSGSAGK